MLYVGKTIKRLREQEGLSQKDFASAAGLTASFVSLLENEKRFPSLKVLGRISETLGVPQEIIFWEAVELPPNLPIKDQQICRMAKNIVQSFLKDKDANYSKTKTRNTSYRKHR